MMAQETALSEKISCLFYEGEIFSLLEGTKLLVLEKRTAYLD